MPVQEHLNHRSTSCLYRFRRCTERSEGQCLPEKSTHVDARLCHSVHKSQGLTLASFVLDFEEKGFTSGLGYVLLSRVSPIRDVRIETQLQFLARPAVTRRIAIELAIRYKSVGPQEVETSKLPVLGNYSRHP